MLKNKTVGPERFHRTQVERTKGMGVEKKKLTERNAQMTVKGLFEKRQAIHETGQEKEDRLYVEETRQEVYFQVETHSGQL